MVLVNVVLKRMGPLPGLPWSPMAAILLRTAFVHEAAVAGLLHVCEHSMLPFEIELKS